MCTAVSKPPVDSAQPALLFVDLDGTLLATDTLDESLLCLVRRRPMLAVCLPAWLLGGKARFKQRVAQAIDGDLGQLPYRAGVLRLIREHVEADGEAVLATAADVRIAHRVAADLGLFSAVLASDGQTNLSGATKRDAIARHAAGRPFDYIGDHARDVPIWRAARRAVVVGGSRDLVRKVEGHAHSVERHEAPAAGIAVWARQLRLHQWAKNLLLAVPLVVGHQATNPAALAMTAVAMLCFSVCASAVYLVNDLLDLPHDRRHPTKCLRPLAAGEISLRAGLAAAAFLFVLGLVASAALLPPLFAPMLAGYCVAALVYSLRLKRHAIVDVVALAGFYAYRVLIGGVAVGIACSDWLLAFSMFLFMGLAVMKRYSELIAREGQGDDGPTGRPYCAGDRQFLLTWGVACSCLSALVMTLYLDSNEVSALYAEPRWLWAACPLILAWTMRAWLVASRGQMDSDPIIFALRDRVSYAIGAAVVGLMVLAA